MKKEIKLLKLTKDEAIYEGGWWMTREDYDYAVKGNKMMTFKKLGFDLDKNTKQITYYFLP